MWDRASLERERRALAEAVYEGAASATLERLLAAVAMIEGYVNASDELEAATEGVQSVAVRLLSTCRGRTHIGQARADGYRAAVRDRMG